MRRQVDLDRLNADNVRFRPEIEDLGGKRMGDGDDGEIRLFAQIEPQSQGTMCREVSNKDVRQRTVVIFLVGGVLTRRAVCVLHSAVHTLDINVGRRSSSAECSACGLGFSSSVRMKPRSIRTVPS